MDVTLVVMGLSVLGVAAGLGAWARRRGRAVERYQATRASQIAQLPDGAEFGLQGTVRSDAPLEDPISKRPCVYFIAQVFCSSTGADGGSLLLKTRNDSQYLLHETAERAPEWALEDETGRVRVEGSECQFARCPSDASDARGVLDWYGLRDYHETRHSCFPVGRQAVVTGRVRRKEGEAWIGGPGLRVEEGPLSAHRKAAGIALLLAATLTVGGGVLTVAGAMRADEPDPPPVREGPLRPPMNAKQPSP